MDNACKFNVICLILLKGIKKAGEKERLTGLFLSHNHCIWIQKSKILLPQKKKIKLIE